MGAKNRSGVRGVNRRGKKILVIDFRYKDKNGREQRYRRDAKLQTRAGAAAEAQRIMRFAAAHGTVDGGKPPPTLEAFALDTFTELALPRFRPGTRERYERLLYREGVLDLVGAVPIDKVGVNEYRRLEAYVRERGTDPRPHLSLLRTLLREAFELEVIEQMPRLPRLPPKPKKLPSAPPWELVQLLIEQSSGWLRVAIAIAYFVNTRNGEARALRVRDVDFGTDTINVRVAFSHTTETMPKSGAERPVPMAAPLRTVLLEACAGKKPNDRIVVDEEGRTPSRQKLYRAFVRLQARLGVDPTWSYHSLRHAFGTHAVQRGANIEAVRELMGHADLAATTRYVHATANDKRGVVELLSGNHRATPLEPVR